MTVPAHGVVHVGGGSGALIGPAGRPKRTFFRILKSLGRARIWPRSRPAKQFQSKAN